MTDDRMDLQALLGKSPDADFLREMIGFAAQRLPFSRAISATSCVQGPQSSAKVPASRAASLASSDAASQWRASAATLLNRTHALGEAAYIARM